jgi:putative transposase
VSAETGRRYPLTMICEVWRVSRSNVYLVRSRGTVERPEPEKRGPKTKVSDEELVEAIREVLAESDFLGEGHRKVTFRLRPKGIRVGKNRVLRLMREHGLLAPVRRGHPRGDRSHSGRITTDAPNELWGTDATRFHTKTDGWCWFCPETPRFTQLGDTQFCAPDFRQFSSHPLCRGSQKRAASAARRSRGVYSCARRCG